MYSCIPKPFFFLKSFCFFLSLYLKEKHCSYISSFERELVMLFTWMGNEKEGRKGVMKRRNEGIGNILINVR